MLVNCKQCKKEFNAKPSDIKRGWGKFCSKSCKAKKQELRTGQYKEYVQRHQHSLDDDIVLDDQSYGASDGGGYYDLDGRPV